MLEVLGRHKAEFAVRYGITALGVFGSVARDEAGEESDVDVVYATDSPNLFRAADEARVGGDPPPARGRQSAGASGSTRV